ncbi:MAG: AAA family ATPase, partial [Pseudomonadota bacterium]
MPVEAQLPFWTVQLRQVGGARLVMAPLHPGLRWADAAPEELARYFQDATQRRWCEQGEVLPWIEHAQPLEEVEVEVLAVPLPSRPKQAQPPIELRFHAMLARAGEGGWLAFIPALDLGAQAPTREALLEAARQAIHLALTRDRRQATGFDLLRTQWYEGCAAQAHEIRASFLGFREIEELRTARRERLLPKAARELGFSDRRHRAYHVDEALEALERSLKNPFTRAVLVEGPAGTGKSALVEELVRRRSAALGGHAVWETTAAGLVRSLTLEGGWQEPLDRVCDELRERGDWLFVRSLAELFEVGRYIGNDVSMAEHLRARLERGELALIAECTPEQAARIEARYPGYLQHFAHVAVREPEPERLERILKARLRADAGERVATSVGAVRETLRLLRRFSPYSGFPGRPVRFLEALVQGHDPSLGPVDGAAVLARFAAETGMPRALIDPAEPLPEVALRAWFRARIFGQDQAVEAVVDVLTGVRAAMARAGRPIASLLFAGPTGVGKTELAKAVAAFFFGDASRMIRFDMSEFATVEAALRLTEGLGGEGRLTGAVRRQPFTVLLLDEIEKAHPLVFDLLLQVLGEGRLTDGLGRVADFCSSLVLMTTNLGAGESGRGLSGFERRDDQRRRQAAAYEGAVRAWFRPELVNRIDRVITFHPLGPQDVARVLDRELAALTGR